MFQAHPDWHNPQQAAGYQLFAAYETPGTFLCLPSSLPVAEDATRSPEFRLDLYSQDLGASGLSAFGLLTIRFRLDYDLTPAREALLASAPHLRVNPLEVEGGSVRFSAPEAFNLPETLRISRVLDSHGANLSLHLHLDGADADLFLETMRRGLSTLFAEVLLVCRGVASRVANVVTFDPSTLQKALWGDKKIVSMEALSAAIVSGMSALPFRFTKPVSNDEARVTAQAVLDRFGALFGKLELSPDGIGSGPYLRTSSADMPRGEVRLDLAEPVLVPRGFFLTSDPLGTARTLSVADLEKRLVQRIAAPAFHSGWRRINVARNFPKRCIGTQLFSIEITAPPFPPARPHTVKASAVFNAETAHKAVELKLSPNEPLRFMWHTLAVVDAGGTVQSLEGPTQTYEGTGDATFLIVPPSAFDASFVILEADSSLLAEAQIEIHVRGWRGEKPWRGKGLLDDTAQELAVFMPHDVTQPELLATAVCRTNGVRVKTQTLPLVATRFDPFSFPGTGARRANLKATFTNEHHEMLIECAPQDRLEHPSRRHLIRLTSAAPEAEFSYVALSPFHTGYCWRWAAFGDTPASSWSEPLNPDTPLRLTVAPMEDSMPNASPQILDGVELTPVPDDPQTYFYRPVAAGIATDGNGRKQLSLIETGTVAMLSLTAMWGVEGSTLEMVRRHLAGQLKLADANAVTLRPALVDVGEVELWLIDASGNLKPFLKATSSGMPPYAAAFNAMLTADQALAVKRALKGERGFLSLRYVVIERPHPARTGSATERETHERVVITRKTGPTGAETVTRHEDHTEAHASSESAKPAPSPAPRIYDVDAADWGLAA